MNNRGYLINEIQSYLDGIKSERGDLVTPVSENLAFLESAKSVFSYLKWLFGHGLSVDPSILLELSDLPNSEKWDSLMYGSLVPAQRKKFPGLIEPIVKRITEIILQKNDDFTLLGFGAGPMEIERQVIKRLKKAGFSKKVIFINVDISPVARQRAEENLKGLINQQFFVEFHEGNVLSLPNEISSRKCDLVYHSLFRHHLSLSQKKQFDKTCKDLHTTILEYDGYRSVPNLVPQSIMAWKNPVFLNAAIFSNLRFIRKGQVKERALSLKGKMSLYQIGYYLLEYP